MSEQQISDEELEQRMRAKLFVGKKVEASTTTDKELRVMEKLLGRDNLERLQTRRPDAGKFRPKPVIVTYEYYLAPGSAYASGGWRINRVENGRPSNHPFGCGAEDFQEEIASLRAKGFIVKQLHIGFQEDRGRSQQPTSQRKTMLERFRHVRV